MSDGTQPRVTGATKRVVLITGTRHQLNGDAPLVEEAIVGADIVLVGDATGVDAHARNSARWQHVGTVQTFEAHWRTEGRAAGPKRNQRMVDEAARLMSEGHDVHCHAFPSKDSRGTWDCIRRAVAAGIPTTVRLVRVTADSGPYRTAA